MSGVYAGPARQIYYGVLQTLCLPDGANPRDPNEADTPVAYAASRDPETVSDHPAAQRLNGNPDAVKSEMLLGS